jgi:hypothetical protein
VWQSFSSTERAFYSKSTHDNLFYQAGDCWQKLTAPAGWFPILELLQLGFDCQGSSQFFYLLTDRSE